MFDVLMLHWVGGEVDNVDIVTIDQGNMDGRCMKLMKQLAKPGSLSHGISNNSVFCLGSGTRHCILTLGGLRDKVVA